MKLLDYKNIVDYTNCYQIVFNKILSLINKNKDFKISKKTIEMTLQKNLLRHLSKNYSALVSAIEMMWKEVTTDLANTILKIIYYAKINKRNIKDMANNINVLTVGV